MLSSGGLLEVGVSCCGGGMLSSGGLVCDGGYCLGGGYSFLAGVGWRGACSMGRVLILLATVTFGTVRCPGHCSQVALTVAAAL